MDDVEAMKATLMARFSRLLNRGSPPDEMEQFWKAVDELPSDHRAEVRVLTETAAALKRALKSSSQQQRGG